MCIGGRDGEKCYADVFILKWDKDSKTIIKEALPNLPKPCAFGAAAKVGEVIYLAGGQESVEDAGASGIRIPMTGGSFVSRLGAGRAPRREG